MGNRQHVTQYGRTEPIRWPVEPIISEAERLTLATYTQCDVIPQQLLWLAEHSLRMLATRKTIGVLRDGNLVAVIRSRFPGSDAKLYLRDGRIETVIDGFSGVELKNIDRSLLVLHEMLRHHAAPTTNYQDTHIYPESTPSLPST